LGYGHYGVLTGARQVSIEAFAWAALRQAWTVVKVAVAATIWLVALAVLPPA
jgi:hypothetical protein